MSLPASCTPSALGARMRKVTSRLVETSGETTRGARDWARVAGAVMLAAMMAMRVRRWFWWFFINSNDSHLHGIDDLLANQDGADDYDRVPFVEPTLCRQCFQRGFDRVL